MLNGLHAGAVGACHELNGLQAGAVGACHQLNGLQAGAVGACLRAQRSVAGPVCWLRKYSRHRSTVWFVPVALIAYSIPCHRHKHVQKRFHKTVRQHIALRQILY